MPRDKKLKVILCWHMHQPDYRRLSNDSFALPWTYLHAIKDYSDMAWHLENVPQAKAVFNFVPILLDQLADYQKQFASGRFKDPLLTALARPDLNTLSAADQQLILNACFRANFEQMVDPFPCYRQLYDLHQLSCARGIEGQSYLSGQFYADLMVWYHLAWMGESIRRSHHEIMRLMAKGANFTSGERIVLLRIIGEIIADIIPRYKKLAQQGRIEISTTPHYHPITPLLLDLSVARQSLPDAPLPVHSSYPGGQARAHWHIESALASHQHYFGMPATGMWPAEGGVSDDTATLMGTHQIQWIATGESVLGNSLRQAHNGHLPPRYQYLYRPYHVGEGQVVCFFRDDRLSDGIGFEYSKWMAEDAVNHFVHHLEDIWQHTRQQDNPVVSIILDGENAWEYYPYNGYYFLSQLYKALSEHPHLQLTTFSEYLQKPSKAIHPLPHLVAGSWVYGNLSTWIGSPEKNLAWDYLCAAKQAFDQRMQDGHFNEEQLAAIHHQLAICEGSDWFWWFGDYNPSDSVRDFDALYRENLAHLYTLLHLKVPMELLRPISQGQGHPAAGGVMRRGGEH